MGSIRNLYEKVKRMDIEEIARQSIIETKEHIADLNAEQLFHGLRSDGSEITPEYSTLTIAIKEEKGQVTDRVTLKDKGDFYAGLRARVEGIKVIIDSTDSKADSLFKKYATKQKNIYGLSGPYKREYLNEFLRKKFVQKRKEAIGL